MSSFAQLLARTTRAMLLITAGLCVAGSFLDFDRAPLFFRSPPLITWWILLWLLFLVACVFYARRRKTAAWAVAAAGIFFIVLGFMWNSEIGHSIRGRLGGQEKDAAGVLVLHEGETANKLIDAASGQEKGALDFKVRLDRVDIEYYPVDHLPLAIKQYRSSIRLIAEGQSDVTRDVAVNAPAHFGGYHIYQFSCGHDPRVYSVLLLVSDSGCSLIYLGMICLVVGSAGIGWWRLRPAGDCSLS